MKWRWILFDISVLLDCFIVATGIMDTWILQPMLNSSKMSLTILRLFRILRLARVSDHSVFDGSEGGSSIRQFFEPEECPRHT